MKIFNALQELMDEFYAPSDENVEKTWINFREVMRGLSVTFPLTLRMLYFAEFLRKFYNESAPDGDFVLLLMV